MARPQTSTFGKDTYPSLFDKAAARGEVVVGEIATELPGFAEEH